MLKKLLLINLIAVVTIGVATAGDPEMDAKQFRELIVRPTLKDMDMWSEAAENLMMGTATQESRLDYLKQLGGGPALSLFQIEPATHKDVWRYLKLRPELEKVVRKFASQMYADLPQVPDDELVYNLRYATAIARIKFWMIPEAMPPANDIVALGKYYKVYYNTIHGKATVDEFVHNYPKES